MNNRVCVRLLFYTYLFICFEHIALDIGYLLDSMCAQFSVISASLVRASISHRLFIDLGEDF